MNINVKAPTRMGFWLMILTCNSTQVVPNGEWRNVHQVRFIEPVSCREASRLRTTGCRHSTDERRLLKLSQVRLFLINGARKCVVCTHLELCLRGSSLEFT